MSDEKRKNEWTEEFEVSANQLVDRVKELIEQGNVRRLIIYRNDGEVLMELPLTASVVAGSAALVFAPLMAALGAAAAFLAKVRIEVVRMSDEEVEKIKNDHNDATKESIDIDG